MSNLENQALINGEEYISNTYSETIPNNQLYPCALHKPNGIHMQIQLSFGQYQKLLHSGYSGKQQNVYYTLRANNQADLFATSTDDINKLLVILSK